jgi:hypothetical protein
MVVRNLLKKEEDSFFFNTRLAIDFNVLFQYKSETYSTADTPKGEILIVKKFMYWEVVFIVRGSGIVCGPA